MTGWRRSLITQIRRNLVLFLFCAIFVVYLAKDAGLDRSSRFAATVFVTTGPRMITTKNTVEYAGFSCVCHGP